MEKIPTGWHLCDGTNGTPDLTGRFLEGTTANVEQFKEAGLPDIKGLVSGRFMQFDGAVGAFAIDGHNGVGNGDGDQDGSSDDFTFSASRSNPIYGRSNTVQPASYTVYYIMRIK